MFPRFFKIFRIFLVNPAPDTSRCLYTYTVCETAAYTLSGTYMYSKDLSMLFYTGTKKGRNYSLFPGKPGYDPPELSYSFTDLFFRGIGKVQPQGIGTAAIDIERDAGQDRDIFF